MGRTVPPVHGHQQAVRRGGAVAECGRAAIWAVYVGQVCPGAPGSPGTPQEGSEGKSIYPYPTQEQLGGGGLSDLLGRK